MRLDDPIGMLDSGFGGLHLLAKASRALPAERFVYYGDFAHGPYGSKPAAEVAAYVDAACETLLKRGVKALTLACNTATSAAAAGLRARLEAPVVGMEPALKPAALAHPRGRILVMATSLTLRERKFRELKRRVAGEAVVDELPCPGVADLIDGNELVTAGALAVELLSRHPTARLADAVVLGCTHYAFVAGAIRQWFGKAIPLYDGVEGTVRRLAAMLRERSLDGDPAHALSSTKERVEFILTGHGTEMEDTAWRLLNTA